MCAALSTQREGAETLGPRVQRRVGRRLADELLQDAVAQALVFDNVRLAKPGDDREAVVLQRQHVAWQHANALATGARHQRDREGLLGGYSLPVTVAHEHDHRPRKPRTREPEFSPWHPGQRACAGTTSSPFTSSAA